MATTAVAKAREYIRIEWFAATRATHGLRTVCSPPPSLPLATAPATWLLSLRYGTLIRRCPEPRPAGVVGPLYDGKGAS